MRILLSVLWFATLSIASQASAHSEIEQMKRNLEEVVRRPLTTDETEQFNQAANHLLFAELSQNPKVELVKAWNRKKGTALICAGIRAGFERVQAGGAGCITYDGRKFVVLGGGLGVTKGGVGAAAELGVLLVVDDGEVTGVYAGGDGIAALGWVGGSGGGYVKFGPNMSIEGYAIRLNYAVGGMLSAGGVALTITSLDDDVTGGKFEKDQSRHRSE